MKKRINKDGSQIDSHCIKLEEVYQHIFDWFLEHKDFCKTDVVRKSVEEYFTRYGGDLEKVKAKCKQFDLSISFYDKKDVILKYLRGIKKGKRISPRRIRLLSGMDRAQSCYFLNILLENGAVRKKSTDGSFNLFYNNFDGIDPSIVSDALRTDFRQALLTETKSHA